MEFTDTLGLPYPAVGEPVYLTRAVLQTLAETTEGILLDGVTGPTGPAGTDGADGADGAAGAPGVGVPAGGTTGQSLVKASGTDYDTTWSTVAGGGSYVGPARLMSGAIYAPPGVATSGSHAVGRLTAVPFQIDVPPPSGVNAIAARVNTAAASGVIALGVYADTGNGFPGARVVDAGTVSAATTGDKYLTVSWSPAAGLYWLACLVTGAATATMALTPANPAGAPTLIGPTGTALTVSSGAVEVSGQTGLPTTFPTTGWSVGTSATRVMVRTA